MDQKEPYDSSRSHQSTNNGNGQQSQDSRKHPYEGEKLPGDPLAITLGIVSIVLFFVFCSCYGVISIITLIISIAGLVVANKSIAQYRIESHRYSYNTLRSVQNARVINIIGTVLSGLVALTLIILLFFFGSIFYAIMDGNWDTLKHIDTFEKEIYEDDNFRVEERTDTWQYEEEIDTLNQESDSVDLQIDPKDNIIEDVSE
jgi:hypothetical protein